MVHVVALSGSVITQIERPRKPTKSAGDPSSAATQAKPIDAKNRIAFMLGVSVYGVQIPPTVNRSTGNVNIA